MVQGIWHSLELAFSDRGGSAGLFFRVVTRYLDLIIVPWIAPAEAVAIYMTARGISLCLPLSLFCLECRAEPRLRVLYENGQPLPFQAAAARINLGYLLICGAVALVVVSCAGYVSAALGIGNQNFIDVLRWLVLGQCASILFGATSLLMRVVERGRFYDMLQSVTAGLFLIAVAGLNASSPVLIAQALAVSQLTLAAACALLLTQSGIWPGLTALFHKDITLF
ncbi:MAG: hypothetical protein ABJJ53_10930 [Sulfitobacter sp.]